MKNLNISVTNKIAKYLQRDGVIVCGNSDYQITFTFDAEWDAYETKTARFIWNGKYWDQPFTGNVCPVPIITGATEVTVGVYAGDLCTTTPASIPCKRSILCDDVEINDVNIEACREQAVSAAYRAESAAAKAEAANPETQRAELSKFVAAETAKYTQLKPGFASSKDDMTDPSKLYVYEGNIWAYMFKEGDITREYINHLLEAGYESGYLSSSSGTVSPKSGYSTTGFIRIGVGNTSIPAFTSRGEQVINLRGISALNTDGYVRIAFYDEGKEFLGYQSANAFYLDNTGVGSVRYELGDDGYISLLDVGNFTANLQSTKEKAPAYFRLCAPTMDSNSYINVNGAYKEEGSDGSYQWANTGYAFVPADYEDRIIDLENKSAEYGENIAAIHKDVTELKKSSEEPKVVGSVAEMVDTSKQYVLDGYVYAWRYQEGSAESKTLGQLSTATDTGIGDNAKIYGGDYNGDGIKDGYQTSTRVGSDGTDRTPVSNLAATGFIEVKLGAVLCFENCYFTLSGANQSIAFYRSDKSYINYTTNETDKSVFTYATDENGYVTSFTITDVGWDFSDLTYVRITTAGLSAESVITSVENTTTEGGYQWVNTGEPYNDEAKILELEAQLQEQGEKIAELEEAFANIETAGDVPDYVKAEAEEVADQIINTRTANSLVLLMTADIHQATSDTATCERDKIAIQHLGMGMAEVRKRTRPNAVVLLGDYVYETSTSTRTHAKEAMSSVIESLYPATNGVTSIWLDGNHDYHNYEDGATQRLTDGEHYALIGANNSPNTVVDPDNLVRNYGYIDFEKQRIRLIYLNTTDTSDLGFGANVMTAAQGQWLINTALDLSSKADADKWGVVVCSHFPINIYALSTAHLGTPLFPDLVKVLSAFKDRTSGTTSGYNFKASYDFTSAKAELIATFHGHIHNFKVNDVITDGGKVIKAICIPEAYPDRPNPYADAKYPDNIFGEKDSSGGPIKYPKTPGTAEDTSFNAVVIDRDSKTIRAICYGAGIDREINY